MRCFFRASDLAMRGLSDIRDLTGEVINYVMESRIKNGHVLVQSMSSAAGVCLGGDVKPEFFLSSSVSLVIFGGELKLGEGQCILFGGMCEDKTKGGYAVSIIGA